MGNYAYFLFCQIYGLTETIITPQNVKNLIDNPIANNYFREFLEEQVATENMDLYEAIEKLKTVPYQTKICV